MAAAIVAPLALWMASPASAASCVSASNGDWGNTLTWSGCGGLIPDSGDSVTIDGESVTLSAAQTAGALTLSTGALTGNGSVTASGTFTKSGSNTFSLVNGADLILNAPGSIADGGFLMSATGSGALEPTLQINSTLTVAAAAADNLFVDFVDDLSPGPLVLIGAGGQLLNQHPGTTTIAFPIDNDGIVESQSGELLLEGGTGGATSSGSYRATASNKLVLASKTFTLGATSSLTGAGAIVVGVAGALSGPSVTVPGGATISPNTLSVSNGGLNVAGSGAFTFTTLNVGPASSNGGGRASPARATSTRAAPAAPAR